MAKRAINRSDLIHAIGEKYHLPPVLAERVVKAIIEKMAASLSKGQRIEIRGFGSFEIRHRDAREARNPKTGEKVQSPAKNTVHFKPGKEMRERINLAIQALSAHIENEQFPSQKNTPFTQ